MRPSRSTQKSPLISALLPSALFVVFACAEPRSRLVSDDSWMGPATAAPAPADEHPPAAALLLPADKRARWEHADSLAALEEAPGRDRSEHLGGRFERSVHYNQAARGYLALRDRGARPTLAVGALVVQHHYAVGAASPSVTFAMLKVADAGPAAERWQFFVLDTELRVTTVAAPAGCGSCHGAWAPDAVFGPPAAATLQ